MNHDRIVLGTAKLGWVEDGDAAAFALLDEYVALGGRAIDTASAYHQFKPGIRSEELIGEWLRARGGLKGLRLVTKGAHPFHDGRNIPRCDEASIRADVELSFRRLGVEHIDLWYMHRDDPSMQVDEIVGVLRALVAEGRIGAFGCSNWTLPRIEAALALGGVNFAANQVLGNVFCATMTPYDNSNNVALAAPMFRTTIGHGLALDAYGGTASGYFEKRAQGRAPARLYDNPACAAAGERIATIAAREGVAPEHLALAFLLHLSPRVNALVGPRTAAQLRASWPAGAVSLAPETIREIAAAAGMDGFVS